MTHLLPYVIAGITLGAPYALAGVGLVLTYRASKVFNFAHGGLAAVAAWLFYVLHDEHNMAWPLAAAISGIGLGAVLGIGFEGFGRRLSRVTSALWIAATVGILISIETLIIIVFGSEPRQFPHFLPTSEFHVAGVAVTYEQLIIVLFSLAATGGLYVVFHFTRIGKSIRAVVDDPDLLGMTGTDPTRVRRWAWIIGCTFATLSGLLLAPSVALDSTTLTLLVVQAFGAAAIGGFASLPLTWVGGILIGIGSSILSQYGSPGSIEAGLSPSLPFIILFAVLLFYPKSRLSRDETVLIRQVSGPRLPARWQLSIGAVVLVAFLLVPSVTGYQVDQWTIILTYALLFLSLGLLVRTAGQVSLCQVGFAAIGAASFSRFLGDGIPWLLALVLACLIVIPIGAVLAIPAVRLSGLYLALSTLGFGLMLQDVFYFTPIMFGTAGTGVQVRPPHLSWLDVSSATGYYYVVLLIGVVVVALVVALDRSRMGRLLRAISDSPRALATSGTNINVTFVLVFCIAAAIAALSGALVGPVYVTVAGTNFDPTNSIIYLAIVIIAVGGAPWYAIPPAVALVAVPLYLHWSLVPYYLQLTFGVAAVFVAVKGPQQFPRLLRVMGVKDAGRSQQAEQTQEPDGDDVGVAAAAAHATRPQDRVQEQRTLTLTSITVRYGGVVAVKNMDFEASTGKIAALIGPNGAGKSTMLNACSGFVRPTTGTVTFAGTDVSRMSVSGRARLGLGRTFQRMDLFDSLSVAENVRLGREASMAGRQPLAQLFDKKAQRKEIRDSADAAIELCGLGWIEGERVASLSTGERRLVELARCLAAPFSMLLLDEPSSGLDRLETRRVMEILQAAVAERGLGVVLVEHDMDMVMSIADEIFVMDFGELLFRGTPEEVRENEGVRAAYLGPAAALPAPTGES